MVNNSNVRPTEPPGGSPRLRSRFQRLNFFGKARKQSTPEPTSPPALLANSGPNLSAPTPAATAPSGEAANIWLKAEQKLREDGTKNEILDAYCNILQKELGMELKPVEYSDHQEQLRRLLDAKVQELEAKKLTVRLGGHSVQVEEQLNRIFKHVIFVKDLVSAAASSSPPALSACPGVTVILTLLIQAPAQSSTLLDGLDSISALICRLAVMENLYRSRAELPALDPKSSVRFMQAFETDSIELYAKIIDFQARATCYLWKHRVSRLFSDAFKRNSWDELLKSIGDSDNILNRYTTMIRDGDFINRFEAIEMGQKQASEWQIMSNRDEKAQKVLEKLYTYTCHYRDRKDRNNERIPGTCEWFIGHPQFREWNESPTSALLWVSADPGCGKSVLARYLVDQILPTPSTSKRSTYYYFFKDDFTDQKSAASALCAILRQMFLDKPHLLGDSLLEKITNDGAKFFQSFHDLWSTFITVTSDREAGEIVCVLDALDECQHSDRTPFIQGITRLYDNCSSNCHVKFLLTSRPYDNIRREFRELKKRFPAIHLSGEAEHEVEKISKEIALVIEHRVNNLCNEKDLKPKERQFLLDQLMVVPNRTYLWATLTIDVIKNATGFTSGNVRREIRKIPKTVDEAYNRILDRSPDIEKARLFLSIVTAAVWPLSVKEMSLMVAMEKVYESDKELEQELEPEDRFQNTLRDICGLFVVIVDSKVYLLHQTAREFLVPLDNSPLQKNIDGFRSIKREYDWKHSLPSVSSNRLLAEKAIWYLDSLFTNDNSRALLEYSAVNWPYHLRKAHSHCDQRVLELASRFCDIESQQFLHWHDIWRHYFADLSEATSSLQVASRLGLESVVKLLLEADAEVDSQNDSDYTSLSLATSYGYGGVVKLLLKAGAKVDIKNDTGQTALCMAASEGYEDIAKLLLRAGAQIDAKDMYYRTPLHHAAVEGHEGMTKLLLEASAHVDSADNDGETPLHKSALGGHEGTIKLLLEAGAHVHSIDNDGETPLVPATCNGHAGVLKQLLEAGAHVDPKDKKGRTPLFEAAYYGHEGIVKQLLEAGAQVDSFDYYNETPLFEATRKGHTGVVEQLLEASAQFGLKDPDRETPLSIALRMGYSNITKLLLEAGAQINYKHVDSKALLSTAIRFGMADIVKMLVEAGAQIDFKDINGLAPLSIAISEGNTDIVRLLLEAGAQVDCKDNNGWTLLSTAVFYGRVDAVKLLIEAGAQIECKNYNGGTALSVAVSKGHADIVKLLIEAGAQVDAIIRQDTLHDLLSQPSTS